MSALVRTGQPEQGRPGIDHSILPDTFEEYLGQVEGDGGQTCRGCARPAIGRLQYAFRQPQPGGAAGGPKVLVDKRWPLCEPCGVKILNSIVKVLK